MRLGPPRVEAHAEGGQVGAPLSYTAHVSDTKALLGALGHTGPHEPTVDLAGTRAQHDLPM
eukprot:138470-Alexandrium_andersonii.AAC.1